MISTLRQAKAKLSELVETAGQGEDVLITVRGKIKARLTRAGVPAELDTKAWIRRLRTLRRKYTRKQTLTTGQILDELREDRLGIK